MNPTIFTIGHSTRSIVEFVNLLRTGPADLVVDIRKLPGSRHNPQFNGDTLAGALAPYQIGYTRIAALGGLRGRAKGVAADVNGWWENKSFHNYADYALRPEFHAGLDELIALGATRRPAIMCSEAVWWRCHRRLVSDYLLARGAAVFHLMDKNRVEPAQMSEGAVVEGADVVYPAGQGLLL